MIVLKLRVPELPEDTTRPWECYRTNTKVVLSENETLSVSPNSSSYVNYLQVSLEFIKVEVISKECICLEKMGFAPSGNIHLKQDPELLKQKECKLPKSTFVVPDETVVKTIRAMVKII